MKHLTLLMALLTVADLATTLRGADAPKAAASLTLTTNYTRWGYLSRGRAAFGLASEQLLLQPSQLPFKILDLLEQPARITGERKRVSIKTELNYSDGGRAEYLRILVGALRFPPDLDRFMGMQGAALWGDFERNHHNQTCCLHLFGGMDTNGKLRRMLLR